MHHFADSTNRQLLLLLLLLQLTIISRKMKKKDIATNLANSIDNCSIVNTEHLWNIKSYFRIVHVHPLMRKWNSIKKLQIFDSYFFHGVVFYTKLCIHTFHFFFCFNLIFTLEGIGGRENKKAESVGKKKSNWKFVHCFHGTYCNL